MFRVLVIIFFMMFTIFSYANDRPRIEVEKKWYGDVYSIGEAETGYWAAVKEAKKIKSLIKSNPEANKEYRKSSMISYFSLGIVSAYLLIHDFESNESSNEHAKDYFDDTLILLPFIFGTGYAHSHYYKKAVNIYNSGLNGKVKIKKGKATLGLVYRF